MVICLERVADLHMAQQMPLPFTVHCFSKIQTGFTFPVQAHLGYPGKKRLLCSSVVPGVFRKHFDHNAVEFAVFRISKYIIVMNKYVMIGPIRCLSQCHPTIANN